MPLSSCPCAPFQRVIGAIPLMVVYNCDIDCRCPPWPCAQFQTPHPRQLLLPLLPPVLLILTHPLHHLRLRPPPLHKKAGPFSVARLKMDLPFHTRLSCTQPRPTAEVPAALLACCSAHLDQGCVVFGLEHHNGSLCGNHRQPSMEWPQITWTKAAWYLVSIITSLKAATSAAANTQRIFKGCVACLKMRYGRNVRRCGAQTGPDGSPGQGQRGRRRREGRGRGAGRASG